MEPEPFKLDEGPRNSEIRWLIFPTSPRHDAQSAQRERKVAFFSTVVGVNFSHLNGGALFSKIPIQVLKGRRSSGPLFTRPVSHDPLPSFCAAWARAPVSQR